MLQFCMEINLKCIWLKTDWISITRQIDHKQYQRKNALQLLIRQTNPHQKHQQYNLFPDSTKDRNGADDLLALGYFTVTGTCRFKTAACAVRRQPDSYMKSKYCV